jgi:hypothetical protein
MLEVDAAQFRRRDRVSTVGARRRERSFHFFQIEFSPTGHRGILSHGKGEDRHLVQTAPARGAKAADAAPTNERFGIDSGNLLRAMKAGMREIGNKAFTMATGARRSENENVQHPPYEE